MAGRPPTPIAVKRLNGDTRKLGSNKFTERMSSVFEGRRGAPSYPAELKPQKLGKDLAGYPEAVAKHVATEKRRKRARAHYDYLIEQLGADGLLCQADGGIILGLAWTHALMNEAAEFGAVKEFSDLQRTYMQASNLCGLNESARAKMARPKEQPTDPIMDAMVN